MKYRNIIFNAAIVGIGVWGYSYLQRKKQEKQKKKTEECSLNKEVGYVEQDIDDTIKQSFYNIASNHQVGAGILKETVKEIKAIDKEAEERKQNIDKLLNSLSK